MKISKKPAFTLKKALLFAGVLVLVGAGGYSIYALQNKVWPFGTDNMSSTQTSLNGKDAETPSQSLDSEDPSDDDSTPKPSDSSSKPSNSNSTSPTVNPSDNNQSSDALAVSITNKQPGENTLHIGTLIERILSDGSCHLTLTNGIKTITKKVGIQSLASSSTCKGFDIDTQGLAAGTWNITIKVKSGSSEGTAKGVVTLK